MGLFDRFRREKALSASPGVVEALQDRRVNFLPRLGGTNVNPRVTAAYQRGMDASYGWIYATQPAVRSVIDFIARNTAQLGLKLYERVDDNERVRDEDHPAAQSLANPDGVTPPDAFIYRLVTDYLIWDNAYVLKFRAGAGKRTLVRLPPNGVTVDGGRFTPDVYFVWRSDGSYFEVDPTDILHWFGYNPDDPLLGLSKLETLRQELATDRATQAALVELAKSGLKGGYIKRPLEAPEWSQDDAERFAEQWKKAKLRGDPILDEGMEWEQTGITPKDAEIQPSRLFTREEVAREFGMKNCPPEGEDERKQFYSDVLAPLVDSLQGKLNQDILRNEYQETGYYFEFDLNEKLRGEPEKRFSAITAAVGRPWMLVEEARALENLPAIEGGDELTIPLNVALGELPAPNVMPPQNPMGPPQDGSHREMPKSASEEIRAIENGNRAALAKAVPGAVPPSHRIPQYSERRKAEMARQRRNVSEIQSLLLRFYERQAKTLKSKSTFDTERWNQELSADLKSAIARIVEREGATYVGRLGGDDFDMRQVEHYVEAMSLGVAKGLNGVTQRDLEAGTAQDAIDRAMNERAAVAGANIGARATVFARREAAKQSPTPQYRKQTWIANTERHAELDGVSVPLGSDWGGIDPGSEPNCSCSVSIS